MKDFDFQAEMQVRDYECDLQGHVNNAVYQNYLEHCRHQFLQYAGIGFAKLHDEGIDAVVIRAEVEYKFPLYPADKFMVQLKIKRQGRLRIVFDQQVIRKIDGRLIVSARITSVLVKNGRPVSPEKLVDEFKKSGFEFPQV